MCSLPLFHAWVMNQDSFGWIPSNRFPVCKSSVYFLSLSFCVNPEFFLFQIFNAGGVPHLLNVLKCAKSEALQLRSCRTVANQAQHKPSCDKFVKLKALDLIIEMLSNCNDDETKLQGIRALRLEDTHSHFVLF